MRADFYDRSMQYPALSRLLDTHRVSVLPMEHKDLRQVIEQPALLDDVQITFESDLVGDLLFDMNEQVGALPLLQFTLDQLFAHRSGHQLTLAAYREIGGVKGAVAKQAETSYASLPTNAHRTLARTLFLRLLDPGRSIQDTTRRRATRTEFVLPNHIQTRMLNETIDAFIEARLLTANEIAGACTLEVSHEALIREWPRLSSWLHESREDIRIQHKLSEDVLVWEQRKKPKDRLYRGSQLKETQRWAKRNTPSQIEAAFLKASVQQVMYSFTIVIAIGLLLLSSAGAAVLFYSKQAPDPTRVTNLEDSGAGSLRWAINAAPSKSTITFDKSLWGHTILLNADLTMTNENLSLRSPGAGQLTIRNGAHRIRVAPGASLNIFGLTFIGSESSIDTLLNNEGTLILTDCVISGNSNNSGGFQPGGGSGGITNRGTLTLTNSIVSGNTGGDISAGGIMNTGTLTLTNSVVSDNSTQGGGGGINNMGKLTVTNSTISGNRAFGLNAVGFSQGSKTLLASRLVPYSPVSGAVPPEGGGGVANAGTFILINSTVSGNTLTNTLTETAYGGGGIADMMGGTLTLINSTISNNTVSGPSDKGGGILIARGDAEITFCTFYGNRTASTNGGGISILNAVHGDAVVMRNSLVAGNHASTGSDIEGSFTSDGYNLIQTTSGFTVLDPSHRQSADIVGNQYPDLHINPKLQQHGGQTQTHALLPGSPAIDAIPLEACRLKDIPTDQRGIRRPQRAACDIGAYEYMP